MKPTIVAGRDAPRRERRVEIGACAARAPRRSACRRAPARSRTSRRVRGSRVRPSVARTSPADVTRRSAADTRRTARPRSARARGRRASGCTTRVTLMKCRQLRLSEKLLPPQLPQPIDSENGSALSKLPPVAKQCAWLTMTRHTGSVSPSRVARAASRAVQPDRVTGALVTSSARRAATAASKSRAR